MEKSFAIRSVTLTGPGWVALIAPIACDFLFIQNGPVDIVMSTNIHVDNASLPIAANNQFNIAPGRYVPARFEAGITVCWFSLSGAGPATVYCSFIT